MADIQIQPYSGGGDDWWKSAPLASSVGAERPGAASPYAGAISAVESGGNYRAIGPATRDGDRALGKYQVMSKNVRQWSKEVLGREVTPTEFINSPDIQDKIFEAKFGSYVQKYGPEGASRAWFAGEGGMNDPNRRDVLGTSVSDYSKKFMANVPQSQDMSAKANNENWWQDAPLAAEDNSAGPMKELSNISENALKPDVGRARAAAEGVLSGASANFRDEIYGASAASGLPEWMGGFRAPVGAARLAIESYQGQPGEATKTYEAARDRIRAVQQQGQEQYPGTTFAGNVVGAMAIPVGGAMNAATLPGRMAKGALVGAGYGAAYGAGEGTGLQDRASRAASGAVIGGVAGAAAPPIIEGATAAVKKVAEPVINTIRGVRNPDAEAGRRVISAIQRDVQSGQAGLTPSELIAARAAGEPVAIMDMGGETTRALGRSAANTSPEARASLNRVINDRFSTQGSRAVEAVRSLVPTQANANLTREALQAAADKSRAPFYQRAFRDGANGVWDKELEQLSNAPAVKQAMKDAAASISNKTASGRAISPVSPSGTPTLEFWDQVKRSLDSRFSVLQRAGDREAAADIQAIKSFLVQKLDDAVPSYATARGVAAELFKASDALTAGEKFVTSSLKNADVAKAVRLMTPEERILFSEGFASKLVDTFREVGDRRNIINGITKSPAARERIQIALGSDGLKKIESFVARETLLDLWRGQIQGNSTTVRQLIEAGLAGGAYGAYTGKWDATTLLTGAIVFGARRGQIKIDERVARRVGEMLASDNPMVLKKGLAVVAKSPQISRALLLAEQYLTANVAQQGKKSLFIEGPAVTRADDNQPEVPRPPGQ